MPRILLLAVMSLSCIACYSNSHWRGTKTSIDKVFPDKLIIVVVNPDGNVFIGRDTLSIDKLADELQRRLWKGYLGTGKMYDGIKLQLEGEVLMGVKNSAMDAIQKAQKKVLTEVCLEKHKKLFESLSIRQQEKIRRQFPVLFQESFQ
jgi:biopolymer transport protein ExbD